MIENSSESPDRLLTQVEVEQRMYLGGIKRAEGMMRKAEENGSADRNPYSKQIFNDYVQPLAQALQADIEKSRPGRAMSHVALLRGMDYGAIAYLAVRTVINICFDPRQKAHDRYIGYQIGTTINSELVLAQIEAHNPALYHTLANDLGRRLSKNERHKLTVHRLQAKKAGIRWVDWPRGSREQVGSYLLGMLSDAGLVEIAETSEIRVGSKKPTVVPRPVTLALHLLERVSKVKGFVAITSPVYGPCVEPPLDWHSMTGGGFHTPELRRTLPMLVRCHPTARPYSREAHPQTVFDAANALQRTAWAVNTRVLDLVTAMSREGLESDEVVTLKDKPKPPKPAWLVPDFDKETMSEAQATEFHKWKRQMADWHTARKLLGAKFSRFYSATRSAEMFRNYPAVYFVYFADSRGRFYTCTYGINPQGSDLQKALIHLSRGKPLDTPDAIRWFHIQGANKFGFDKATLSERFMWAHERRDWVLLQAADPLNNREWMQAGDPFQFLAWCFEYAAWVADPDSFVSHLPISMDGSCNGLQNLSAMLRDEIGGEATNLTDNETMQDIYGRVAEAAVKRLQSARYDDEATEKARQGWLAHGIKRSVVKRAVMTTPYGVTKRTATDYVIEDYLKHEATPFDRTEFRTAAKVLMDVAWPAIGDVVVKGRLCMDWLSKGARKIIKALPEDQEPIITWTSPSGFPASQSYFSREEYRVNTRLAGTVRMLVSVEEGEEADPYRHSSGLAPNFVHSMDAAHLHRVAARCLQHGIDAAMIHDDYGTHAADAALLFRLIREEFVAMYEEFDPVQSMFEKYPEMGQPPSKGTLNIREVLDSAFFFS
jgi:DNA-directed RNA polymerase